ncbi:MAG: patatin [Proteobacteria bacterium]|nr:patatin [Pseudomonadota bacterium]
MSRRRSPTVGLVMAAGGARAAYQAGVLSRIGELPAVRDRPCPFRVIEGISAGAVNAAAIVDGAENLTAASRRLADLWSGLSMSDVVRTDLPCLAGNAMRWLFDLAFGGLVGAGHARSLLDPAPLRQLLARRLDFARIHRQVRERRVHALALTATDYTSGRTFIFVEGGHEVALWRGARRRAVSTQITLDHVLASAAIPLVFPPVRLTLPDGPSWFGDGCLRMPAPAGPAIRLGADRLLAIGLRHHPQVGESTDAPLTAGPCAQQEPPPLSQILGVSLSALFVDQLDADTEHLERINRNVQRDVLVARDGDDDLRRVDALFITPSVDLSAIAKTHFHHIPPQIRYLLGGLGVRTNANADLLSHLMFEAAYTRELVAAGRRDADARIDEIEALLTGVR